MPTLAIGTLRQRFAETTAVCIWMSPERGGGVGHENVFSGFTHADCGGGGSTCGESGRGGFDLWGQSHLCQKALAPAAGDRQWSPQTARWWADTEAGGKET